jgi:hypothetical protein
VTEEESQPTSRPIPPPTKRSSKKPIDRFLQCFSEMGL